jgi:hypothetical protein
MFNCLMSHGMDHEIYQTLISPRLQINLYRPRVPYRQCRNNKRTMIPIPVAVACGPKVLLQAVLVCRDDPHFSLDVSFGESRRGGGGPWRRRFHEYDTRTTAGLAYLLLSDTSNLTISMA